MIKRAFKVTRFRHIKNSVKNNLEFKNSIERYVKKIKAIKKLLGKEYFYLIDELDEEVIIQQKILNK